MSSLPGLANAPVPVPAAVYREKAPLSVVLADERAIVYLIDQLLSRAGLNSAEVCRRLNISESNFSQYRSLRRKRPSLWWFVRLAQACGARVMVEFPVRPL
jgi:hypothetical protein